jgi:hypothetical protein
LNDKLSRHGVCGILVPRRGKLIAHRVGNDLANRGESNGATAAAGKRLKKILTA